MHKVKTIEEQQKVNKVLLHNDAELKKEQENLEVRVKNVEDNFHKWELDIKDIFHEMESKIANGVALGNAPLLDAIEKESKARTALETRIHALEDAPMRLSMKIMMWALAGMGTIIITLLGAWLKLMLIG